MKMANRVFREILYRVYDRNELFMSQNSIASACGASLGTINSIVKKLEQLGTIKKRPLGFRVIDPKKILIHWANIREFQKDFIYSTHSHLSAREIELRLPAGILTAYSAFPIRFGYAPADYREVHVYGEKSEIERAFPPRRGKRNLFVVKSDPHLERLSNENAAPLVQIYADLWWLGPPAKKFIWKLEQKLKLMAVERIEEVRRRAQKENNDSVPKIP